MQIKMLSNPRHSKSIFSLCLSIAASHFGFY